MKITKKLQINDYKIMRIISDEVYAGLIKLLAQDEKVALFQKLLLSEKAEPAAPAPAAETNDPEEKK